MTALAALAACGDIKQGSLPPPNDTVPNGVVIAQGQFEGANGSAVSGAAKVYRLTETGNHVIRLEGMSVPTTATLQVVAKQAGETVYRSTLRYFNGNQNYTTSVTNTQYWESVSLTNPASNVIVGNALLQSSSSN